MRPTASEVERLVLLAEEAGEVVQAVAKVLRHGYGSFHPRRKVNNQESLSREIADFGAVVQMMVEAGDIDMGELRRMEKSKRKRVLKYTYHQAEE